MGLQNNPFFLLILLVLFIAACDQRNNSATLETAEPDPYKQSLLDANKARVKVENRKIKNFVKRNGWDVITTGTGLRYLIYEKGSGPKAQKGSTAIINYTIKLLDGTLSYSSDLDGTKGIQLGKAQIENGVDEGILLMHVGDKAKFILPSHLAHGLVGDGNKIPSHSVLVYDVELIDLK